MPGIIILSIFHVVSYSIIVTFLQGKDSFALNNTEKKMSNREFRQLSEGHTINSFKPVQSEYVYVIIIYDLCTHFL